MDGVLSIGKARPRYVGGRRLVSLIKSSGRKTYVLTNDSTHTRREVHRNLRNLGFHFAPEDVMTSGFLTARYLTNRYKRSVSFLLLGERGLLHELLAAGHNQSNNKPDVVVVGLDRGLTYSKLDQALRVLKDGASLIGSYGGAVYMGDNGPALSAGPIIRALEYGASKRAIIIGKPSSRVFRLALKHSETKANRAVMVGDQIETDIRGAVRAGVHTVLVLSGVETRKSLLRSSMKPELVIENVDKLERYL